VIHLHTGLPGAGKTLCTLVEVLARSEKEKRPVYYHGIAELTLPWIELRTASEWHTVPDGSIVVIDECQSSFRPRHTASHTPEYVAAFETHRHRGIDVYLVTQHPKLLDANIRRLAGSHVHFVRAFGAAAVTRHHWNEVREDPQVRADSESRVVPFPKDAYAWYRSAERHTHGLRLPFRLVVLLVLPLLIGACVYGLWRWWAGGVTSKAAPDLPGVSVSAPAKAGGSGAGAVTAAQYLSVRQPRIADFAHTAPLYDGVTAPVTAPYPAACVSMGDRCSCYSQQATLLDVSPMACRQIVARGFFKDWEEKSSGYGGEVSPRDSRRDQAPNVSRRAVPESAAPVPASSFSEDLMRLNRGGSSSRNEGGDEGSPPPSRPAKR